jgi:hypothetical protein
MSGSYSAKKEVRGSEMGPSIKQFKATVIEYYP